MTEFSKKTLSSKQKFLLPSKKSIEDEINDEISSIKKESKTIQKIKKQKKPKNLVEDTEEDNISNSIKKWNSFPNNIKIDIFYRICSRTMYNRRNRTNNHIKWRLL